MIILYGIPNCDTVKKARVWLSEAGIEHAFHDYKKSGADPDRLRSWVRIHGWEKVLNRAGTTFRKLSEADRSGLDADKVVSLMLEQPSMIKRPVLEVGDRIEIGFRPERYAAIFERQA